MELFFVTVIGACLGAILRYTLPHRNTYGAFLLPAIGAAATAAVWVALVWVGLKFDGTWIWVASIGAGILASLATALILPRKRSDEDSRKLTQLTGGRA